jgi:acyl transferase domain-containing protein
MINLEYADYALEYLKTQKRLHLKDSETLFFAFTLSEDRNHRLKFTKVMANTPEEAYEKFSQLGEWVDLWKNEIFPTIRLKK